MTRNQRNAALGIAEYASGPAATLVAAPLLLRALGVEQFGIWVLVTAVGSTAAGLGGGIGEAATFYVSRSREGSRVHLRGCVTACLGMNIVLGAVLAILVAALAPVLVEQAFRIPQALHAETILALRAGALLIVVRAADAVLVASVRAHEQYTPPVVIGFVNRVVTLGAAITLALSGHGLAAIILATVLCAGISAVFDARALRRAIGGPLLTGEGIRERLSEIRSFGGYSFLKSATGVVFAYVDRLAVASLLGAAPLAFYALANQLTQPMASLLASGSNFLFPHLSALSATGDREAVRRKYRRALTAASACTLALVLTIVFGWKLMIVLWLGPTFVGKLSPLLVPVAVGNALLALTVVPQYAALALGRAREVALVNVAAAGLSIGIGAVAMMHEGIAGAATIKVVAGCTSLLIFAVARRAMNDGCQAAGPPIRRALEVSGDD